MTAAADGYQLLVRVAAEVAEAKGVTVSVEPRSGDAYVVKYQAGDRKAWRIFNAVQLTSASGSLALEGYLRHHLAKLADNAIDGSASDKPNA